MLTARYAGLVVPPLPPKTFFGRSSAARLRGLTLFAERLARVPTLLLDSLASAFFGLPGADSWETAVRRAEQTRFVYERHSNPGLLRWHALIEKVLLPEDPQEIERLAASVSRELRAAEGALAAVEKAAELAVTSAFAHAEAMAVLATANAEWARIEDADIRALNTLPQQAEMRNDDDASPVTHLSPDRARSPGRTRRSAGGSRSASPPPIATAAAAAASAPAAATATDQSSGFAQGGYTALSTLLRGLSGFIMLEQRIQAAQ